MYEYKVTLTVDGITDHTHIEANSAEEAVLFIGASLGVGMVAGASSVNTAYQLFGLGYIQATTEDILRETLSSIEVEEI